MARIEFDQVKNQVFPYGLWALACISGLRLPRQTVYSWQQLMREIDTVDDVFDTSADKSCTTRDLQNRVLQGDTEFTAGLTQPQRDNFSHLLKRQCNISVAVSKTPDPDRYARLSFLDGAFLSKFFLMLIPENITSQNPEQTAIFRGRLANLAGAYKLIDNIMDLKKDHQNRETIVTDLPATQKALLSRFLSLFP